MRTLLFATMGVLAACGGGAVPPPPRTACTTVAPPQLVYPSSNATAVPDGSFQIAVAYSADPSLAYSAPILSANGGNSVVQGGAWTAGTSGQWASAVPVLAASTTYAIAIRNTACSLTYTLGSFTTK